MRLLSSLSIVLICKLAVALQAGNLHAAAEKEKQGHAGYSNELKFSYQSKGGAERERTVFLWYPTDQEEIEFKYVAKRGMIAPGSPVREGRYPLLLFSHGFWGGADQSVFLMEGLARAGYIVAALHHDDAMANQARKRTELPNFIDAKSWEDDRFYDRKEDMTALLDELLTLDERKQSPLHHRIKREHIGAVGHSLGGYTVLGLAGARQSWKDDRIKAALLLSPYILPYFHHGNLAAVKVPVMLQGGTRDIGVTPFLKAMYEKLNVPKYYLVLKGVDHYGWTDLASRGRTTTNALKTGNPKLIAEYSRAFFDQYLLGVEREETLTAPRQDLHRWWAKAE